MSSYEALIEKRIYIGGADDVSTALQQEAIDVVVDLRAEVKELHERAVHLPIVDGAEHEAKSLQRAVQFVLNEYREGRNVYFHCQGGSNRTGAVATALLLELKEANNVEAALAQAKAIRSKINVREELVNVLIQQYE